MFKNNITVLIFLEVDILNS